MVGTTYPRDAGAKHVVAVELGAESRTIAGPGGA